MKRLEINNEKSQVLVIEGERAKEPKNKNKKAIQNDKVV